MPQKVDDMKRNAKKEVEDRDADINDNIKTINHIYENVPLRHPSLAPAMPEFHKYFHRDKVKTVIYENLCRGCGYGKFAAQGHYCNFCQCVVNGGVLAGTGSASASVATPPFLNEANIYENICELCRGIYSDNDRCECQQQAEERNNGNDSNNKENDNSNSNISNIIATTNDNIHTNTNTKSNKSRSLLSYSKSSAATLSRFFGSLRQLNRSGSLQRGNTKEADGCDRGARGGGGGRGGLGAGSLEIIHNVDEVFHTQATFDMNQICELKQNSQSDQHIYGRLRVEQQQQRKVAHKRPRISRRRMLQQSKDEQDQDGDQEEDQIKEQPPAEVEAATNVKPSLSASSIPSIYLNESICQWMSMLRRDIHGYDDSLSVEQQPKSMPASYDRLQSNGDRNLEMELVRLRRPEESLVDDFKRQLQMKHQQRRPEATGGELHESRRRGINEHHNVDFLNEFLKQLPQEDKQCETVNESQSQINDLPISSSSMPVVHRVSPIPPLWQLMQSAFLAASIHPSVRGFLCAYDKSLSDLLIRLQKQQQQRQRQQQQQQQRSAISIERWLRRCYRLRGRAQTVASLRTNCESAISSQSRLLPVVPATPASDNVLLLRARPLAIKAEPKLKPKIKTETEIETETETAKESESEVEEGKEQAAAIGSNMAAPLKPKQIADQRIDDNENAISNNNNNNNITDTNNINNTQQQTSAQNCVIKVRRRAPQVPIRNPSTALTKAENNTKREDDKAQIIGSQKEEVEKMEQDEDGDADADEDGEESIYQTIWQYKTLEPNQNALNESEEDDEQFEVINVVGDDTEVLSGVTRQMLTKRPVGIISTYTAPALTQLPSSVSSAPPSPSQSPSLPSPTISMDQNAWERAGDEFQFSSELETLSLGSTVTNSTATLGSISSSISNTSANTPITAPAPVLIHPLLRNICIIYSPKEPKKYSAIYYDYQRSLIHQKFMTRLPRIQKYHRPAPPIPSSNINNAPNPISSNQNDDSGCSCEDPPGLDALKEEWALAVLAAAASTKRGAGAALAAGPRSARKLRVRSQARLLLTDSVLAWREQLQRTDYCEDEEDMIVPVTDILRAQQIQEDNEVQQTQQTTILQRFKSASIGNLTDLPGEDDKKSIKNRMLMKFANVNGFRINRSPKSEKKSRQRRSQANSLYLDEPSKYPLFGAPLNALELNMTDHPNVPRFVVDICAYIEQFDCIEQDGLYRVSGNKLIVDELKRKLTHLYDPRFLQTDDVHTLTSLHKQFFRELSAPLITQEAYERLGRQLTDEGSIERMRLAFDDMPEPNRSTLRFLIKHLTKVAEVSVLNRMPASNLAIVWGPCLLTANQIQFDIGRMNMLAKILIENHDRIFRPENERLVC